MIYKGNHDDNPQNLHSDFSASIEYFQFGIFLKLKYDFTPHDKRVSGTFQ